MQIIPLGHLKCIWQCRRGLANINSFSQVSLIIFLRTWVDVGNLTHSGGKRKSQCLIHKNTHTTIPNNK